MLNHLLNTRYTSSSPPLVVLSDSLLQPGLSLFHQLISSSPASTNTILLCGDLVPSRALPHGLEQGKVQIIDCTVDQDFPQPFPSSSSSSPTTVEIDLGQSQAQRELEQLLSEAVKKARAEGGAVQIAIDGINSFADELGIHGVWRLLKKGLKALEGLPRKWRFQLLENFV